MLALDDAVEKAGGRLNAFIWIVVIVLFVLAWGGAIDGLFGWSFSHIVSFWMFIPLVVLTSIVTYRIGSTFERIRYAGLRASLHTAIENAGLTTAAVVSKIEGDTAVSNLSEQLKIDIERGPAKDSW